MTKSYVVDPETGKLLTAEEWKEKAEDKVMEARMIAIVPDDGSPAFAMPVEDMGRMSWGRAMECAAAYKAPHVVKGSDGTFTLPSRKQAVDIRAARENGLDQLLEMIGAESLLADFRGNPLWTRETYRPAGLAEDEGYSPALAWYFNYRGFCYDYYVRYAYTTRPVTLLNLNF